jgi:ribokinase
MGRVIVAGSINMDVVATANRHPKSGETVAGEQLHFIPGGKGANQAVAAAKLGAETLMIGKLGNDGFGDELNRFLRTQGVNLSHVTRTAKSATGTALIVVANSENTIVVVPGANDLLKAGDVSNVSFAVDDILVSQFEIPIETVEAFFRQGKSLGARTILNPAPAKSANKSLLELADVLVVNETELAFFTGQEVDDDAIREAAATVRTDPSQVIIVTLGAKGAFVLNGRDSFSIAGRQVSALDTTGAGDCFVGALASELAKGVHVNLAVNRANIAASICVERLGAGPSMPTAFEVDLVSSSTRSVGVGS